MIVENPIATLGAECSVETRPVLVVSSEAGFREMVSGLLASEHCSVEFEESRSPTATAFSRDRSVSLVLIDLLYPLEEIYQLLPAIKEAWPDSKVIFFSELEDMEYWTDAIQRGAYEYYPKQLDRKTIRMNLLDALDRKEYHPATA